MNGYKDYGKLLEDSLKRELHQDGTGYLFNTAPGVDPFTSFRQRFPHLAARLEMTIFYLDAPWHEGEDHFTRTSRITCAAALMLLPQYEWRPSNFVRTHSKMRSEIQNLLRAPIGTIWYAAIVRSDSSGTGIIGHAQPILSTNQGSRISPNPYKRTWY
ncbi:hypothetical protein H710_01104 [Bartonella bacilliformis Ver097]|uniref:Uncharacterized protein n=1 Tax=Bartonella bacilliformis Ver097 TaxID=1293911 RepID=A0A072R279_BARBA|nr:hypothetical protein H710_01104 [Bartonella bacilliformis Ver097]